MHERGKVRLLHAGLRQAQIAQPGESGEQGHALIVYVIGRKEMKAEIQPLQVLQSRQRLQGLVGVKRAVGLRRPSWTGKVQLPQLDKAANLLQILRIEQRPYQIKRLDPNIPSRQLRKVIDWRARAVQSDPPAQPDGPLGYLALTRSRGEERTRHQAAEDTKRHSPHRRKHSQIISRREFPDVTAATRRLRCSRAS